MITDLNKRPGHVEQQPHTLVARAEAFATKAHEGQERKFSGKPYIVHPSRVVTTLRAWGATDDVLAAGWLHDTVEDCDVTVGEIKHEFGPRVATLVGALTKPRPDRLRSEQIPDGWQGNRKRAAAVLALRQLDEAPPEASAIKCADRMDNLQDYPVAKLDYTYIAEAAAIHRVARDAQGRTQPGDISFNMLSCAVRGLNSAILEQLRRKGEWID